MTRIQVFEHSFLVIDKVKFQRKHFVALSKLNQLHNDKYFHLRHNGIRFKQYVGVIQVEGLTIEILPKIDNDNKSEAVWQKALIEMLRVTRKLKVQKVGEANVNRQQIHLLDIYFEWFLKEVELLIRQGLIKQYYQETKNVKALKGKLEFAGHVTKNIVHKERFYTTHQVYDKNHLIHQVLAQAMGIIATLSKGNYLYNKCKTVQINFPDVDTINANEKTFFRIPSNRKTAPYNTALAIARLIILNYAPNVSSGSERMLALLFDMNSLWEEYILARIKQAANSDWNIYGQNSTEFWSGINIRPDIVLENKVNPSTFIIDTKWKNIDKSKPSTNDLRQMYVYNDYWDSKKAMLLYPSNETSHEEFKSFEGIKGRPDQHKCSLSKISIFKQGKEELNDEVGIEILKWFEDESF